jgi:hypothetical protein
LGDGQSGPFLPKPLSATSIIPTSTSSTNVLALEIEWTRNNTSMSLTPDEQNQDMMDGKEDAKVSVRMSKAMRDKLEIHAQKEQRTVSSLLRKIAQDWLEAKEQKL